MTAYDLFSYAVVGGWSATSLAAVGLWAALVLRHAASPKPPSTPST